MGQQQAVAGIQLHQGIVGLGQHAALAIAPIHYQHLPADGLQGCSIADCQLQRGEHHIRFHNLLQRTEQGIRSGASGLAGSWGQEGARCDDAGSKAMA